MILPFVLASRDASPDREDLDGQSVEANVDTSVLLSYIGVSESVYVWYRLDKYRLTDLLDSITLAVGRSKDP